MASVGTATQTLGDSMTKADAKEILERYRRWNIDQKGFTPEAQAVLDARRRLILKATQTLAEER